MQRSESDRNKTPLSVRLDAGFNERVTPVARALDRPKSWVIEQAVQDFVAMQEWQLTTIDEGLRAADAGRVIADEDVVAWVQSWGRPDEVPVPECEWPGLRLPFATWRQRCIASVNPKAANRQIQRILAAVAGLLQFSEIGRPGRRAGTRALVASRSPYIAAYRVAGDTIEILPVMHSGQRWPEHL